MTCMHRSRLLREFHTWENCLQSRLLKIDPPKNLPSLREQQIADRDFENRKMQFKIGAKLNQLA